MEKILLSVQMAAGCSLLSWALLCVSEAAPGRGGHRAGGGRPTAAAASGSVCAAPEGRNRLCLDTTRRC